MHACMSGRMRVDRRVARSAPPPPPPPPPPPMKTRLGLYECPGTCRLPLGTRAGIPGRGVLRAPMSGSLPLVCRSSAGGLPLFRGSSRRQVSDGRGAPSAAGTKALSTLGSRRGCLVGSVCDAALHAGSRRRRPSSTARFRRFFSAVCGRRERRSCAVYVRAARKIRGRARRGRPAEAQDCCTAHPGRDRQQDR